MPTNPSQTLSVHVGITAEEVEMKDVERGAVDHSPPVALHSALTTILHLNSFEVNVRLRFLRLPGLKAWVACFGPVLMLSLLSSLPFYVAIGRPNKSIQKYPIAECSIVSFQEIFRKGDYNLEIQVWYQDSYANPHTVKISHRVHDYSVYGRVYIQRVYEDANSSGVFPCYYWGDHVIATVIPPHLEHQSFMQGWHVTVGFGAAWLMIIMISVLLSMTCKPNDRTVVPKEIYEGGGPTRVDVEDWGLVRRDMHQPLHAFLYAWLARESGAASPPNKQVRIVDFETYDDASWDRNCLRITSIIIFLVLAAIATILICICFETDVVAIEAFWCMGVILVFPASLASAIVRSLVLRTLFRATAEISSKTDNTVIRLNIDGKFYRFMLTNGILEGSFLSL